MENQDNNQVESNESKTMNAADTNSFLQAALFECWPGGPIVSSRADCRGLERDSWRNSALPELQITDSNAGRNRHS